MWSIERCLGYTNERFWVSILTLLILRRKINIFFYLPVVPTYSSPATFYPAVYVANWQELGAYLNSFFLRTPKLPGKTFRASVLPPQDPKKYSELNIDSDDPSINQRQQWH